jgi:hypothetical protein
VKTTKSARKQPGKQWYVVGLWLGTVASLIGRPAGAAPGVVYRKVVIGGTPVHVVQADLNRKSVQVTIALPEGGIGHAESWSHLIGRARPAAALTGTYFDIPTAIPVGTIRIHGKTVHRGKVGTALAISGENRARLVACRPGGADDWSAYASVLRAGPRLLDQGRVSLYPQLEGFRDRAIMAQKSRAATGITRHNKLLLVGVARPISLRKLAAIMAVLGAHDAMCMDGGTSAGLYYHGKSYVVPHRALTNLLVIYDAPASRPGFKA